MCGHVIGKSLQGFLPHCCHQQGCQLGFELSSPTLCELGVSSRFTFYCCNQGGADFVKGKVATET